LGRKAEKPRIDDKYKPIERFPYTIRRLSRVEKKVCTGFGDCAQNNRLPFPIDVPTDSSKIPGAWGQRPRLRKNLWCKQEIFFSRTKHPFPEDNFINHL